MKKIKFKPRNPLHDHPLMRKSGIHEKSYKTKRNNEKQKLRKEWFCLVGLSKTH